MCFYIKVMHFKLVILTRVANQTPSYLIYTHFLNMMEELHQIWPSASNLCNITRREIYIWFKYLTSLLQVNCEHYSDHWGVEGTWHALYSWTSSWIHVKWQNVDKNLKRKSVLLWRCCSVSCSLEKQICSQSFSDKHTAAWWIYWSLLEYKLTEKNDKFQFFFFYSSVQVKDS